MAERPPTPTGAAVVVLGLLGALLVWIGLNVGNWAAGRSVFGALGAALGGWAGYKVGQGAAANAGDTSSSSSSSGESTPTNEAPPTDSAPIDEPPPVEFGG